MVGTRVVLKSLVLVVIVVLFLLPLTALKRDPAPGARKLEDSALTSLLSEQRVVSGWQATPLETYYPDEESGQDRPPLSDKVDGGDVQYYELGFRRLFARELQRDRQHLFLEEYVMADPQAAFGIWSANRGPSDVPFACVVPAAGLEDRAVLYNGSRYVALTAEGFDQRAELESLVATIGKVLREFDPSAAPISFPLGRLPRIEGSERLIVGPISAQSVAVPDDVLGVTRLLPGWSFSVPCGGSFVPAIAVLASADRWRRVASHFGAGDTAVDPLVGGTGDDRSFVTHVGDYIVIGTMIASDQELADFRGALGR